MSTELFPTDQINVEDRVRHAESPDERESIEDLRASLRRFGGHPHGLLQPILLDETNTLQDGWRRLTACLLENWPTVPVHRRKKLSESDYFEIELEANFRRLDFTWRQIIALVCKIHRQRQREAVLENRTWSQDMTGELLGGYSKSYVSNCLILESVVDGEDFRYCLSITDAMRVYYRHLEDAAVAEQAKRTGLVRTVEPPTDTLGLLLADEGVEKGNVILESVAVDLSRSLYLGDSIRDILPHWPHDSVDHIITDPPYCIDVEYMQQTANLLSDVSRVRAEHTVDENTELFAAMMPVLFRTLREGGFLVLWCDQMSWQYLYDLAIAIGFGVQRWPLVWCKPQAGCQMTNVLITKATEIAMVCRKGTAQLPHPVSLNWHLAANDDIKLSNPFAKPFEIWQWLLESFSTEGQTVLDPFAGEGSAIVAGLRLNRRMIGIEKVENHFNYMIEQVKAHWQSIYKGVKFI